jgi:hypothetical protein
MNLATQRLSWLVVGALGWGVGGIAAAQDPAQTAPAQAPAAPMPAAPKSAAKSTAQIDAGEPRANTSGSPPPAASSGTAPANPSGSAPAPASGASTASKGAKAPPAVKAPGGTDRLDLGTATVTGDREQPKVMYIVPWKKSDIGDLSGKPMNSLLDEALAPVDRDEFKREVAYFNAVKADTSQNGAANGAAKQVEK